MIETILSMLRQWPDDENGERAHQLAEQIERLRVRLTGEPAHTRQIMIAEIELERGFSVLHVCADCALVGYLLGLQDGIDGLLAARDIAERYGVTLRRARALIANRHRRFGIGRMVGSGWVVHEMDLWLIEPEGWTEETRT